MDQQTKAALKQDQFVTTTSHGLEWASENRRSVLVTAGLLLLGILVLVLLGVVYNRRAEAASTAFGAAMQVYQTPLASEGQAAPGAKTFASAVERAKAANGQFLACADKYSLVPDGKVCRYFAGLTYTEAGQTGPAEDSLKKVAGSGDLGSLANLALAQLYRQTSRDGQAIELLKNLAAKPTTTVPPGLAQLQLADLYTAEGKPDEAKKIYAQLHDKDAKSAAGLIAAEKLNPSAAANPGLRR